MSYAAIFWSRAVPAILLVLVSSKVSGDSLAENIVPPAAQLAKAEQTLHSLFKTDFADMRVAGRRALARRLIDETSEAGVDLATQYVCLRDARELSIAASDPFTAIEAGDQMARIFKLNALELDVAAYTIAAPKVVPVEPSLVSAGLDIVDRATSAGDLLAALKVAKVLMPIARKTKDLSSVSRVQSKLDELNERQQARQAEQALERNPQDPEANFKIGRIKSFFDEDWRHGLPLLAKGSESTIKELAEAELSAPPASDTRIGLADRWWNLSLGQSEGIVRLHIQAHAVELYQLTLSSLSGNDLVRARARIDSLGRSAGVHVAGQVSGSGAGLPAEPGLFRSIDGNAEGLSYLEFMPSGTLLARSMDGLVQIWDLKGKSLLRVDDHDGTAFWSRDDSLLIADQKVWELSTGKALRSVAERIRSRGAFTPDRNVFAVLLPNMKVMLCDVSGRLPPRTLATAKSPGAVGSFSDDGLCYLLRDGGDLSVYEVRTQRLLASLPGAERSRFGRPPTFVPNSHVVLASSNDERSADARMWDWARGRQIVLCDHKIHIEQPVISNDGHLVFLNAWGEPGIWDTSSGEKVCDLEVKRDLHGATFSPRDKTLIVGTGSEIIVFDARHGQKITSLPKPNADLPAIMAISGDGRILATAHNNPNSPAAIHLWKLPDDAVSGSRDRN